MFRSDIHKAAERNTAARINSYKLTEKTFATGTSNNLPKVI